MRIRLKNLGILKHAEFSPGDLTIICGENNTGKTYATYALYGFLQSWRELIDFSVSDAQIQSLLTEGVLNIDLSQYVKTADQMLAEACGKYNNQLDGVFAATEGRFSNSEFHIEIEIPNILDKEYKREMMSTSAHGDKWEPDDDWYFSCLKRKGSQEVVFALQAEKKSRRREMLSSIANRFIHNRISDIIFSQSLPFPILPFSFINSTERTGVATFRREIDFAHNQLLEEMFQAGKKIDPRDLLSEGYQSYPWPIRDNVNFIRGLGDIAKRKSFIAREHPEVLEDFADIIGGDYSITQNDLLYYIPRGTGVRLTMVESSSAVRSLLNMGFYLNCVAHKGDMLMVDEPELSLHPGNQRRIARLFARLVNLGVKVFVTTHSDYIVKELNTLIMLNHDKPHLKRIAQENGYRDNELISSDQVKVYMAQEDLIPLEEGQKRRRRGHTLVAADIDPELGVEAPSFDETIEEMNRIQRDIVWGAE